MNAWKMANRRCVGCERTRMNSILTPIASPFGRRVRWRSCRRVVQALFSAWMRPMKMGLSLPGPMRWCCLTRLLTWSRSSASRTVLGLPGKFRLFSTSVPICRPTIIFHGTHDNTVPFEQAERFTKAMREAGNICDTLRVRMAGSHGFFNYGRGDGADCDQTVAQMDDFLVQLGFLEPKS